jgi:hypothetical protein
MRELEVRTREFRDVIPAGQVAGMLAVRRLLARFSCFKADKDDQAELRVPTSWLLCAWRTVRPVSSDH